MNIFTQRSWLGQVPLILGPSSWGFGMVPPSVASTYDPIGIPPYWGEWGVVGDEGFCTDSGQVGPFATIDEAFGAAADAAGEHGATALPGDGWAQVKDSRGRSVGPIT
jgi:hypothetical protein